MSTNYSGSLDSYSDHTDNVDDVLAAHVNNLQDAVEALEAKVGIDSSSVVASLDYLLKHASGAYRTHLHDGSLDDGPNIPNASLIAITTVSKVSGAALYLLANIPAGAGLIPVANIDTGTIASKILILNASAQIPAVDGSLLTGVIPLKIENRTSDPGSPATGQIWFRTDI
jgi:hypothetical protein